MGFNYSNLTLGDKFGVNFGPGEKVKIICHPNLNSALYNQLRNVLVQALFMAAVFAVLKLISHFTDANLDEFSTLIFMGVVSAISVLSAMWAVLKLKKTTYIVTDLSVIIHHDLLNSNVIVISINEIKDKVLKKTLVDKHFNTGTVKIFTGQLKDNDGKTEKVYDDLQFINDPEHVFSLV